VQLTVYLEAVDLASKIALTGSTGSLDSPALVSARTQFRELYNGKMSAIENASVANAMIRYEAALSTLEACDPPADATICKKPREVLLLRSICLAHSVRASVQRSWAPPAFDDGYTVSPEFRKLASAIDAKRVPLALCDRDDDLANVH
jgi:hypothetical protein